MNGTRMQITPKNHVAPGTKQKEIVGWVLLLTVGPILLLATVALTYGLALIGWIIGGFFYFSRIKQAQARLKGSAVEVSATQFPEIHAIVEDYSRRLGLAEVPTTYIIEDNQLNAAALKHGAKNYVMLIDDTVFGSIATGNNKVLSFIIAHELAHHALGHTKTFRRMIASNYTALSRLDEFSCDAVAHALVGDVDTAHDALALLLIGPQLFGKINRAALDGQAKEVAGDKNAKKSERTLSHPLLLRRYHAITHPSEV